ncbi:methyl-accepting chemotaxis protein [Agaribacterium sp. ZY112]|uniref:methyl-accepting chemotaxis protein n=1 Tax=Agaribacterium sp. ZY112 TaxID=3233574 RepID=UPI0035239A22
MKAWFLNLSLGKKQVFTLLLTGLLPMLVVGVISLQSAKSEVEQQALNQLAAVRDIKSQAVQRYFKTVEQQILTMASERTTVEAMRAFTEAFDEVVNDEPALGTAQLEKLNDYYKKQFGEKYSEDNEGRKANVTSLIESLDEQALLMQSLYISDNNYELGSKHKLDFANGESSYHSIHKLYHPSIRNFLEAFGYYDIFMVDIESGDIVYSVFKELDYATSLLDGPYRDTNFADAFNNAARLDKGEFSLVDFASYTPSYEAPASFIATPIFDNSERIGVLVFQMPLEPVDAIMDQRSGMGESGESYLVGPDFLMRSDSHISPETHSVAASFRKPELGSVDTFAAHSALDGNIGAQIITDYNGNTVLSAYAPLDLPGFRWAALSEVDVSEAYAGVTALRNTVLFIVILTSVVIVFFAFVISKVISGPVLNLASVIQKVQKEGDFSLSVNNPWKDEVGQTSRAFNTLLENLSSAINSTNFVLSEIGKGNFEEQVAGHYPGQLGLLSAGVNSANTEIAQANIEQKKQAGLAADKATEAEQAADQAEERAKETLVIKQALDVSATAVMIADEEFNVIYCNDALDSMMFDLESTIQKELPHFNASKILGNSIDQFHKQPEHQRRILSGLTETYKTEVKLSGLTFALAATPIKDLAGSFLGAVVEWQDLTAALRKEEIEKELAEENARIRQALDSSSTSTMIADDHFNIIYTNASLTNMMKVAEDDLKEHLGKFDSAALVGANMDVFHKDPAHQRAILEQLKTTYSNQVQAGKRHFSLTANPIVSDGERIGTVVEWVDRTEEVAVEKEVDELIDAAAKGDFSSSLVTENKSGFYLRVSEGLNRLLSTTNVALEDIMAVLSSLAQGDLSKKIERDYEGEFAQLKSDANSTVDRLRDIIADIGEGTSNIARSSSEISSGTNDLSQRTEEQASSLEETSSTMEEITRIVQNSAESAQGANNAAQNSVEIAREGNERVQHTIKAMKGITEASEKIANIIGVIDEIAFQTNLLALNAAVEAARAGEQGRGFAVVATEVRQLAQRSASAAKEIKELINDSVDKVEQGSGLVHSSGASLSRIVGEIESVGSMMQSILDSANEQVTGIQQVGSAIAQMDQITQQNAALVEQASSASENMADEAGRLDKLVSFFRSK